MNYTEKCQVCKGQFELSELYEYRGFSFCSEHFEEGQEKVNYKREQVMETTEASVKSQRSGEFVNNRKKYHLGNVAGDGLPIITPTEPQILKDYEKGIL